MTGRTTFVARDGLGSSKTLRAYEDDSGVLTPKQVVDSFAQNFREGFNGVALDPSEWSSSIGGGTVSVGSGNLVIGSGTTVNGETYILSNRMFKPPFRLTIALSLSQRIANQTFFLEMVSVNETTGVPDGSEVASWLFDSTTATNAKYRVQTGGLTPFDSAAVTTITTASPSLFELEPDIDSMWFHQLPIDTVTGRTYTYRRHTSMPNPSKQYKIRLRWLNGATAPASNTNATIAFVAMQDYHKIAAELMGGRGMTSNSAQSIPVQVANTVSVSATAQDNIFYSESVTAQASSATLTGTSRDVGVAAAGAHRYTYFKAFAFADEPGTMRLECSVDNTTWRRMTADTAVAANTPVFLTAPVLTRYHRVVYVNGATANTAFMLNSGYSAS